MSVRLPDDSAVIANSPFFAAKAFVSGAVAKSIGYRGSNECEDMLRPDWHSEVKRTFGFPNPHQPLEESVNRIHASSFAAESEQILNHIIEVQSRRHGLD